MRSPRGSARRACALPSVCAGRGRGQRLCAPGRPGAQRPALFSWLCFKYLTNIAPSLRQIPRPGCRPGTRAHCGAERTAKGAGGGRPEGALGSRRVDAALWVAWAESWGETEAGEAGLSSFSRSKNKNWEVGALALRRTVSRTGREGRAEVRAEPGGVRAGPGARSAGRVGAVNPRARRLASYQAIAVHSEKGPWHSDTPRSMAFQRKPTRTGRSAELLPPPSSGPKTRTRRRGGPRLPAATAAKPSNGPLRFKNGPSGKSDLPWYRPSLRRGIRG